MWLHVLMGVIDDSVRNCFVASRACAGNVADAGAYHFGISDQRRERDCASGRRQFGGGQWRTFRAADLQGWWPLDVLGPRAAGKLRACSGPAAMQIERALDVFRKGAQQHLRCRNGRACCSENGASPVFGPRAQARQRLCSAEVHLCGRSRWHGDAAGDLPDGARGQEGARCAAAAFDVHRAPPETRSACAIALAQADRACANPINSCRFNVSARRCESMPSALSAESAPGRPLTL